MSEGLKERQAGPVTVLEIDGDLTIRGLSTPLDEKLQALIAQGHLSLLLDFSQVSDIDSQGIKALVRGFLASQKLGGKLKLLKTSPRVRDVLNVTHLTTVIQSFDDEEAALRSFDA